MSFNWNNNYLKINNQPYYPYANANCTLPNTISVNNLDLLLDIRVFPNPTSESLSISLPENSLKTDGRLFYQTGKEVLRFNLFGGDNQLDVRELKSGIYTLKIDNQNFKLIKN